VAPCLDALQSLESKYRVSHANFTRKQSGDAAKILFVYALSEGKKMLGDATITVNVDYRTDDRSEQIKGCEFKFYIYTAEK
jgi:hypothetical protein